MEFITDASEFPEDEEYHTVTIEEEDEGYHIAASSENVHCFTNVGSIGIAGNSAGIHGRATFEAASGPIKIRYVDYTDEYDYEEMQLYFDQNN